VDGNALYPVSCIQGNSSNNAVAIRTASVALFVRRDGGGDIGGEESDERVHGRYAAVVFSQVAW